MSASATQSLEIDVVLMFRILFFFYKDNQYLMVKFHNSREMSEPAEYTWQIAWSLLVCKLQLNSTV